MLLAPSGAMLPASENRVAAKSSLFFKNYFFLRAPRRPRQSLRARSGMKEMQIFCQTVHIWPSYMRFCHRAPPVTVHLDTFEIVSMGKGARIGLNILHIINRVSGKEGALTRLPTVGRSGRGGLASPEIH